VHKERHDGTQLDRDYKTENISEHDAAIGIRKSCN